MSPSPAPPPATSARPLANAAAWSAAWALGLGGLAALLLLLAHAAPSGGLLAGLALNLLPAMVDVAAPRTSLRLRIGLWTGLCAAGVALAGGVSGPLAPLLAAPALALLASGGPSGGAAVLALAAVMLSALLTPLLGLGHGAPDLVPARPWLRTGVVLLVAVAAAYAVTEPRFRAPVEVEEPGPDLLGELAQARAAAAAAEGRAESRARFIAQMSHELRTPLNAILGFSDIMRTRLFGPLPDRYAEYAQLIHESGGHLLDLINDVLDLSKVEADRYELRLERFDVREAVNDAMRLLRVQAQEAGIALRALMPTEDVPVEADRRALKQVVLNLVSNALKFTPHGGAVDVIVRTAQGALELVVSDTGVGIAPEDLARLGGAYEQAAAGRDTHGAAQGTGLGLSLVKAFAKLHGGDLVLESRLGEGTAATVRLPVLIAPAAATGDGPPPAS